jgi:hypothetical protein
MNKNDFKIITPAMVEFVKQFVKVNSCEDRCVGCPFNEDNLIKFIADNPCNYIHHSSFHIIGLEKFLEMVEKEGFNCSDIPNYKEKFDEFIYNVFNKGVIVGEHVTNSKNYNHIDNTLKEFLKDNADYDKLLEWIKN